MTRQPLVLMGSLVTWTRRVWPFFRMSCDVRERPAAGHLALARLVAPAIAVAPLSPPARATAFWSSPLALASDSAVLGLFLVHRLMLVGVLVGRLIVVLVGLEEIGGVEEGALLLTDVHERGLDSGEDGFDPSEVDVADGAAVVGTVDQQLDQPIVFQDRHAGFPLAPVDEDLALHERTSAAPTRSPRGFLATEATGHGMRKVRWSESAHRRHCSEHQALGATLARRAAT